MKYFYDTEFIEGTQEKRFLGIKIGSTKPTIDLISIGIVCEDGREYYAVSKDFNLYEAWNRYDIKEDGVKCYWIRENVLLPIYKNHVDENDMHFVDFSYSTMKNILRRIGKSNKQIAKEVKHFIANRPISANKEQWILDYDSKNVELYGYYSAYDHVVFCWMFGKMIDLPKGYPMYTIDLKQMEDILMEKLRARKKRGYPEIIEKHDALSDARFNRRLYNFLQRYKYDRM